MTCHHITITENPTIHETRDGSDHCDDEVGAIWIEEVDPDGVRWYVKHTRPPKTRINNREGTK